MSCTLAVVFVAAAYMTGQWTIRATLAEQARATAEAWYRASMHSARGDLDRLIDNMTDTYERDAIRAAGIDGVVALDPSRPMQTLAGDGGRMGSLEAIAASKKTDLASLPAGSYPVGESDWLRPRAFHSWVLLPPAASTGSRLAVHIDQTAAVQELTYGFMRQAVYTLGTGIIAFFAFMAGYTYRAQSLMRDHEELRRVALNDELTGLPNRKHFNMKLAEAIKGVGNGRGRAAVMLLDLDGFKAVNDTLGHQQGDELLKATAHRLARALREGDILARLSGDEFAIIVPRFSEVAQLTAIAERIQIMMAESFELGGQTITAGCSIGVAVAPDNGDTAEALFRNADFALYRAKGAGKRTWRFFDPNMAEELHRRMTIEDRLRTSLDADKFTVLYQPQLDLITNEIVGYEALLRWRLPGERLATTASFLRIAEETGLIIPIGENVIRQAAKDCARLPQHVRIAVNLSAAQLKREAVADFIKTAFDEHGADVSRLDVEVNETVLGRDEAMVLASLSRIQELGAAIVLDDFRPSSFGLLTRAPFNKLKLSGKFLTGVEEDAKSRAIVAAICHLGRSLEMEVAAQGVETAELAESLPLLGCTRGQGHFFGDPRPLSQLLEGTQGTLAETAEKAARFARMETIEELDAELLRQPDISDTARELARVA